MDERLTEMRFQTMAFAQADAEEASQVKRTVSVSSAGPSGVVINDKPKVNRVARKRKYAPDLDAMAQLPFSQ